MKFLRIGLWSAACAVMAVLLLTTAVGCMADHYIFQPPRGNPVSSRKMELLPVEEKISIAVCHLPAPSEEGFTILYSHGNAEDLSGLRYRLPQFPAHGYGIIAYDYEGYGASGGTPSEENVYRDADDGAVSQPLPGSEYRTARARQVRKSGRRAVSRQRESCASFFVLTD